MRHSSLGLALTFVLGSVRFACAQELRPESFVTCFGYGECGPGYIPIERDWTWVGPGSEEPLQRAIREVLVR